MRFLPFFIFCFISLFAEPRFEKQSLDLKNKKISLNTQKLLNVIEEVLSYWQKNKEIDKEALHGGYCQGIDQSSERLLLTLQAFKKILEEDKTKQNQHLQNIDFLSKNFDFFRWYPDAEAINRLANSKPILQQMPKDHILITKYYVKSAVASAEKTPLYSQAMYGLPFDEANLSQIEGDRLKGTRFQFGKQAIYKGALDLPKPLAPTLIFVSRKDFEDALLQGTLIAQINQKELVFNVFRNNGVAYDRTKTPEDQERFWYFRPVKGLLGYGKDSDNKVKIETEVVVAGDVPYFGLGRIFLTKRIEFGETVLRLLLLADTGGAFNENRFQLDWLSGQFNGYSDFQKFNKNITDFAEVYILLKK